MFINNVNTSYDNECCDSNSTAIIQGCFVMQWANDTKCTSLSFGSWNHNI